jgi:hypothetical protein
MAASNSSTRTVADPAYAFESRQNRRGENWRRLRDVAMDAGTASDAGCSTFEAAGVEFIDESGGPGVQLPKPTKRKQ